MSSVNENSIMKFASGVGVSKNPDSAIAVSEAIAAARSAIPAGAPKISLCFAFATSDRNLEEVASQFEEELKDVPCAGATTCANVLTPDGPVPGGVSALLLAASPGTFLSASAPFGETPSSAHDSAVSASRRLEDSIKQSTKGPPKAIFVSASPGNEEKVLEGIHTVFGDKIPIVGGSAADNDVSGKWAVFHAGKVYPAGVVMFSVSGNEISVGAAMAAPYKPTDKRAKVTRVDGRTVLTLNDKPAADWLYSIVGDSIEKEHKHGGMILGPTSTVPLSLRKVGADGTVRYLTAHAASINQPDGGVSFFIEAKEGDDVIVMDTAKSSAHAAGAGIKSAFTLAKTSGGLRSPSCAILVCCGGLSIAVGEALRSNLIEDFASIAPGTAVGMTAFGE